MNTNEQVTPAAGAVESGAQTEEKSGGYAWLVVFLLMGAYVFSFVDRQILSLMVEPIRADLQISDTQMSLLMGIAFSLFYSLFGIPLARWADRRSRRNLIVVGVGLWSLATASCGLMQRYATFFMARIGVGVGEATLSPAAFSLISDYFGPDKRASAISVYSAGTSIGAGVALLLGGLLLHVVQPMTLPFVGVIKPWQVVFLLLGLLGLLYCPLLLLVREPVREREHNAPPARAKVGRIRTVLAHDKRTLALHHFGFAAYVLAAYGSLAWVPVFFIRVRDWTPVHTGIIYGGVVSVFGTAGMIFGGWAADRLFKRGCIDASLRVGSVCALVAIPFVVGVVAFENARIVISCLAIATFFFSVPTGLGPASIQGIVPSRARAQVSAVFLLIVNLVGQGLGPTAVALTTDYVFGRDNSVGLSLIVVNVVALALAAFLLALACRPYRRTYQRLHTSDTRRRHAHAPLSQKS